MVSLKYLVQIETLLEEAVKELELSGKVVRKRSIILCTYSTVESRNKKV